MGLARISDPPKVAEAFDQLTRGICGEIEASRLYNQKGFEYE